MVSKFLRFCFLFKLFRHYKMGRKQGAKECGAGVEKKDTDIITELRLIPEFDGGPSQPVAEWLDKVELISELRGLKNLHSIVPLRLTGGAFAVYQQLSTEERNSYDSLKQALISAFAVDRFCAYEQFITRKLRNGEAVDVYLADLRRLARLFGGMPDASLACAFVAGLPEQARRALRAGSRMEAMTISQLLARARAVLVEEADSDVAAGAAHSEHAGAGPASVVCHSCGEPNHYARDCLSQRGRRGRGSGATSRSGVRCYRCHRRGHLVATCPGNDGGEESSAVQASSPAQQ